MGLSWTRFCPKPLCSHAESATCFNPICTKMGESGNPQCILFPYCCSFAVLPLHTAPPVDRAVLVVWLSMSYAQLLYVLLPEGTVPHAPFPISLPQQDLLRWPACGWGQGERQASISLPLPTGMKTAVCQECVIVYTSYETIKVAALTVLLMPASQRE